MRTLRRLIGVLVLLWAVPFAVLMALELTRPETPPLPDPADAILCLGAGMSYGGWDRPGPASMRRARSCAELYRAGVAPVVLFTGYGHEQSSAAAAMARVAMEDGVPEMAVILEEEAKSTFQNAVYSAALLPPDTARLVVVTDAFHIPRSWMLFRITGAPETTFYPARLIYTSRDHPETLRRRDWVLRESMVIWANIARAGIYLGAGVLGVDQETRVRWFN